VLLRLEHSRWSAKDGCTEQRSPSAIDADQGEMMSRDAGVWGSIGLQRDNTGAQALATGCVVGIAHWQAREAVLRKPLQCRPNASTSRAAY